MRTFAEDDRPTTSQVEMMLIDRVQDVVQHKFHPQLARCFQPPEAKMRISCVMTGLTIAITATTAHAGSQSSNTSSNSSSNNGVVRQRVVDTYCEDGYCERYVERRVYQDDRRQRRYRNSDRQRRYRDYRRDDD